MNCKEFKTRTKVIKKKKTIYYYCNKLKKNISYDNCRNCQFKEYKQYKKLQTKSEYHYKPKKGKCNRYYNDVSIMPKNPLYSTVKIKGYSKHHIFNNVANRPKSERYGLFVWLSEEQHRYLHDHPKEMLKLKKIAQLTFMKHYNKTMDEFREIFGKSWI